MGGRKKCDKHDRKIEKGGDINQNKIIKKGIVQRTQFDIQYKRVGIILFS